MQRTRSFARRGALVHLACWAPKDMVRTVHLWGFGVLVFRFLLGSFFGCLVRIDSLEIPAALKIQDPFTVYECQSMPIFHMNGYRWHSPEPKNHRGN